MNEVLNSKSYLSHSHSFYTLLTYFVLHIANRVTPFRACAQTPRATRTVLYYLLLISATLVSMERKTAARPRVLTPRNSFSHAQ